ncbi:MAG: anthranilate synthase component II [Acidobacteriota bacterium]
MILMVDNYDSFTYNLVQYMAELGEEVKVVRNDALSVEAILGLAPRAIVISPGPGRPEGAGVSVALSRAASGHVPLLGVCLGHQAIGAAFGAQVVRAPRVMHGKTSLIHHDGKSLFTGLPLPFEATRYHSLVLDRSSIPESLVLTAWTDDGTVMGIRHQEHMVEGVQFHPESILTSSGKAILANFLRQCA